MRQQKKLAQPTLSDFFLKLSNLIHGDTCNHLLRAHHSLTNDKIYFVEYALIDYLIEVAFTESRYRLFLVINGDFIEQ